MASPGREGGVPGAGPGPGAGKEREMRHERPQAPVGEESGGGFTATKARRGGGPGPRVLRAGAGLQAPQKELGEEAETQD